MDFVSVILSVCALICLVGALWSLHLSRKPLPDAARIWPSGSAAYKSEPDWSLRSAYNQAYTLDLVLEDVERCIVENKPLTFYHGSLYHANWPFVFDRLKALGYQLTCVVENKIQIHNATNVSGLNEYNSGLYVYTVQKEKSNECHCNTYA